MDTRGEGEGGEGGGGGWSQEAAACVEELLCHKVVEAQVAYYAPDQVPAVRFHTTIDAPDGKVTLLPSLPCLSWRVRVRDGQAVSTEMAAVLVEEGYAKWADPPSPEHKSGGPFRQPPPLQPPPLKAPSSTFSPSLHSLHSPRPLQA